MKKRIRRGVGYGLGCILFVGVLLDVVLFRLFLAYCPIPDARAASTEPGFTTRKSSRIVACRALPALHTQPPGAITVVVLPAPPARPAGSLCVRVYNRTPEGVYRRKYALSVEQQVRARLWRRSRYQPYTEGDLTAGCPGFFTAGAPRRIRAGSAPFSHPCLLIYTQSEDFFEGYGPAWNPLPGDDRAPTLQPGRYRVCVHFWQGQPARLAGWEEWPNDWLLTWPWRKRCSPPFRFPPEP